MTKLRVLTVTKLFHPDGNPVTTVVTHPADRTEQYLKSTTDPWTSMGYVPLDMGLMEFPTPSRRALLKASIHELSTKARTSDSFTERREAEAHLQGFIAALNALNAQEPDVITTTPKAAE